MMKYIESTPLPDGTYDHTEVIKCHKSGLAITACHKGSEDYVPSGSPVWYPTTKYRARVLDTYGIHESSSTLREIKGDAGPAVAEMLLDRIKELETQLMHEIGAHCDTRWKLREARAALNKEPK